MTPTQKMLTTKMHLESDILTVFLIPNKNLAFTTYFPKQKLTKNLS